MGGQLAHNVFLPYYRQINDLLPQDIELKGPGDVIGLDQQTILRTDPPFGADYEPNFMPLIEFSKIDLPWCYSPTNPREDTPNRLNPWICLIVLKAKDGEYKELSKSSNQPLPVIKVNKHDLTLPLPDITYSWAWAHVQVTADKDNFTLDELRNIMVNAPEQIVSRLVCPRKLEPKVLYHAFVVPTYESGRLTGLRQEIPENTPILKPAWTNNLDSVELPYYFKWEFHTGLRGDFAYLVRLLELNIYDSRVGIRHFEGKQPTNTLQLKMDPEEARKLVLLIRGDLLKMYPLALIYAVKGVWVESEIGNYYICTSSDGRKWNRTPNFTLNKDQTKYPIYKKSTDIIFLRFNLTEKQARGHTEIGHSNDPEKHNNPGWFFVIEEAISDARFGIDEQINDLPEGAVLDNWDNLTWQYFIRDADWNQNSNYINGVNPDPDSALDPPWDSHSANRAKITLKKPVRIAIHADDIMVKEN